MQSFPVRFTSRLHLVIYFILGIFISALLTVLLERIGLGALSGLLLIVFVCFAFYYALQFSKQEVNFFITEDHLQIKWIKKALFSKKQDQQIEWSRIKHYILEPDRVFDVFTIKLLSGQRLSFSISNLNNDIKGFSEFYRNFLKAVAAKQATGNGENASTIEKGKTFYETPFGIGLAIVMGVAIFFLMGYDF